MTKGMLLFFSLTLSLSVFCSSAFSEIYKWTDENGKVRFSDVDPLNGASNQSKVKPRQRSFESFKQHVDTFNSEFYKLYQTYLQQYPSTSGEFRLKVTVEPNGEVSKIRIVRTQLNLPVLEGKLLGVLKNIMFEEQNVESTTFVYSLSFPLEDYSLSSN